MTHFGSWPLHATKALSWIYEALNGTPATRRPSDVAYPTTRLWIVHAR